MQTGLVRLIASNTSPVEVRLKYWQPFWNSAIVELKNATIVPAK